MPDRYWVGGTASWDGTAGTKWSETSGGPGGASVPTSADDVFFTNLSTGTCTIATGNTGAKSINCTGFTGTITGTVAITVSGSVTLDAAMTWTHTGTKNFSGTGTLTTAGKTFGSINVNGAGITLTLGDALDVGSAAGITVTQGTFTTANHAVSGRNFTAGGTLARTVNFGSSTVTLSGTSTPTVWIITDATNLTFNAGTSHIMFTGGGAAVVNFIHASLTYYDVSFVPTVGWASRASINGPNAIFNNLTFDYSAPVTGRNQLEFTGSTTINGTLTCTGFSATRRAWISRSGGTRVLTVGTLSAPDCDFQEVTIAGGAIGTAPTRAGDCGGNSGIIFPAAKTVYRVGTNTTWAGSNSWATASGDTGADNNFPLPQDTAVIDNSTALTGTLALTSQFNFSSIDASQRTTAITLNHDIQGTFFGSYLLGSGVTVTGTNVQTFAGAGIMNLNGSGRTITFPLIFDSFTGGTLRLTGATTFSNTFTLTRATLDLNNFTLTATTFGSNNPNIRTLAFGTGNITVTSTGTVWITADPTNLTVTGTPVVNVTNNTATATVVSPGTPAEANSISFNFTAGTYALNLSASNVRSLNFTGFSGTLNNQVRTIFGDLTLSADMTLNAGANRTTFASTSATPRTIRTDGKVLDFELQFNGAGGTWRLLDALTMGSTRALIHFQGALDLNGFNLTVGSTYTTQLSALPKNITFNGGTLTCPGAGSTAFEIRAGSANFTTTAGTGTGTINMTSASAKTFVGNDSTFNCNLNNGGAGALTITGNNTFTTLTNSVQPTSFLFTAGTTTTLTNWNINGTAGNPVTIGSTTAAQHTLSKSSGTVTGDYLSISRSTATGGATWNATNSTDGGNNTGWIFGAAAGGTGNFFSLFL